MILRAMHARFTAIALIAAAAMSLRASAWAFSQQNVRSGGTDSSKFADPDNQFTNSGTGRPPFGSNGPTLQFGVHQGPLSPFGGFQDNDHDDGSFANPYYRPLGSGNN